MDELTKRLGVRAVHSASVRYRKGTGARYVIWMRIAARLCGRGRPDVPGRSRLRQLVGLRWLQLLKHGAEVALDLGYCRE